MKCRNCPDAESATFMVRFIDGEYWYLCAPCVLNMRLHVSPECIVETTCISAGSADTPERETYLSHK